MNHIMRLYEEPFNSIESGKKLVEVRLNDEKRRRINIGDTITFSKITKPSEILTVVVMDLEVFSTFKEMYESIHASYFDSENVSIEEMVEQTYEIYTPEQEIAWGTLAITIRLLENQNC